MRNKYIFTENPEGKRPLTRQRRWWEYNNKIDFKEVVLEGAVWFLLAQDRDHLRTFVNRITKLGDL
jgi:hypothetical protein